MAKEGDPIFSQEFLLAEQIRRDIGTIAMTGTLQRGRYEKSGLVVPGGMPDFIAQRLPEPGGPQLVLARATLHLPHANRPQETSTLMLHGVAPSDEHEGVDSWRVSYRFDSDDPGVTRTIKGAAYPTYRVHDVDQLVQAANLIETPGPASRQLGEPSKLALPMLPQPLPQMELAEAQQVAAITQHLAQQK